MSAPTCLHRWIAWTYDGKRESYRCDDCNQEFTLTPVIAHVTGADLNEQHTQAAIRAGR